MLKTAKCLYCGKVTDNCDYIVNPGAYQELRCCGQSCFEKTQRFIIKDSKGKKNFYLVLFTLVIINLFLIALESRNTWSYFPMFGICLSVFVFPSVFVKYERYQTFGIEKTRRIIRVIVAGLAIFAIILMISAK
jgi:uncharacterized membrane protein